MVLQAVFLFNYKLGLVDLILKGPNHNDYKYLIYGISSLFYQYGF
jgi:hypothetical protein